MEETTGKLIPVAIEDEMKESYLNYAMSVIVSRALPDARGRSEAGSPPYSLRNERDGSSS